MRLFVNCLVLSWIVQCSWIVGFANANANDIKSSGGSSEKEDHDNDNDKQKKMKKKNKKTQRFSALLKEDESVVLITGAGGFLGSELALALYRTYRPRKLLLIDSLDVNGFGPTTPEQRDNAGNAASTEQELALLEFKRQRVFRVLQALQDRAYFYRVDLRPSIPEFFDGGQVPALHHIFEQHNDITHVVHLADHYHRGYIQQDIVERTSQQAVPRVKGQPKAGMMEALLEQLIVQQNRTGFVPHFTYASSYQVYPSNTDTTLQYKEDMDITTPSTLAGTSKLLDEIMAQLYYETDHIYSVGLRYFSVYGPWGVPGTPLFEMAEKAVAGQSPGSAITKNNNNNNDDDDDSLLDQVRDYIYIDDAIDMTMAAMQFVPLVASSNTNSMDSSLSLYSSHPPPVVFNVGSGHGTTLRKMVQLMRTFFPGPDKMDFYPRDAPTTAVADLARAQRWLGYQPQVTLKAGLERTLAWHYDRAYPYGGKPNKSTDTSSGGSRYEDLNTSVDIRKAGIVGCSRFDAECLQGTPVFSCASECSHEQQCYPSYWDDVLEYTRALTVDCPTVLYTVALEVDWQDLPSTLVQVSNESKPYASPSRDSSGSTSSSPGAGSCNLAFVSDQSVLYQRVYEQSLSKPTNNKNKQLKHGHWTLVPVRVPVPDHEQEDSSGDEKEDLLMYNNLHILRLLPKLSPALFFSATTVYAIYCDPDIIIDSVPRLLEEMQLQPKPPSKSLKGATALLIGKRHKTKLFDPDLPQADPYYSTLSKAMKRRLQQHARVQDHAYRMIQIAAIDELVVQPNNGASSSSDNLVNVIDSSLAIHLLNNEDSRLFRCDVYGEVVQWDVVEDHSAFHFILNLHDMWSRITFLQQYDVDTPYWTSKNVETVPITYSSTKDGHRRLEEEQEQDEMAAETTTKTKSTTDEKDVSPLTRTTTVHRRLQGIAVEDLRVHHAAFEHNGFGVQDDEQQQQQEADESGQQGSADTEGDNKEATNIKDTPSDKEGETEVGKKKKKVSPGEMLQDVAGLDNVMADELPILAGTVQQDPSLYDSWLAILSSKNIKYFGRLVNLEAVGAAHVDRQGNLKEAD